MAIYHLSVSNISRAKGSTSCATLAYISGEKIHDSRTGKTYSYSRCERVLVVGTILPASAPLEYTNAETLWNAVENYETADNARTAKKIQVALPRELELSEQKTVIEEYIRQNLAQEGYCATYAIHDGGTRGNPHAHILVSNRTIDRKGNWGVKRKMAYALDERGNRIPLLNEDGTQRTDGNGRRQWKRVTVKQNKLDSKDFLLRLRKAWADVVNLYLSPSEQIDHRSNVARGIEDIPTIHEGYAARAIEKRGGIAERCEINREIRRENADRRQAQVEIAERQANIERLQKAEREDDRIRADIARRKQEFARRKRKLMSTGWTTSNTAIDNDCQREDNQTADRGDQTTGTRDYVAELLAYRRAEKERETTRTLKEREDAEKRKREAKKREQQARGRTNTGEEKSKGFSR